MSLLPNVEQELLRVARAGSPARTGVPRPRLSGALLAVAVSVLALMIGAGFLVALHGARGGHIALQTLPPAGSGQAFPGAPRPSQGRFTQHGIYICPRLAHNRYLPRAAGCVSSVLHADMTGDGHKDLVILYADLGFRRKAGGWGVEGFTLEVVRPGGETVRTSVRSEPFPWITSVGNMNEVPGDELILHLDDISSGATYGIYTLHAGRIELVRPLLSAGGDSSVKEGFACEKLGQAATLTSQTMLQIGRTIDGRWRWTVTLYAWHGATLRKVRSHTFVRHGDPKAAAIPGGLCGRPTGATQGHPG